MVSYQALVGCRGLLSDIISLQSLNIWFDDIWKCLTSKPELLKDIKDLSQVFNQDETAIEHGVSDQWVLGE